MAPKADPIEVAAQFNEAINAQDLETLGVLMTGDHRFVDAGDNVTQGRNAVVDAWRGFFSSFPDYRNDFETFQTRDELVIITGRSRCADERLDGPALWTARVKQNRVAEWRVYEDTAALRSKLGLS